MDTIEKMLTSFHDYDIRGIYPIGINEDFFYRLGKAVAKYVGRGPIAVGHDARVSSPSLTKQLVEGITDAGVDVILLGLISTEIHNYASGTGKYEANVMVSASHNPKEYNGAKMALKGAVPLHGGFGLPEIKAMMLEEIPNAPVRGQIVEQNVFDDFMQNALRMVKVDTLSKMKVVVDAGNGVGGPAWQKVIEFLPEHIEVVPLYLEPDGTFPNHESDPLKDENVRELRAKVVEVGADLGIALDGDADRIFFIDEKGNRISATLLMAIVIDHFMRVEKRIGAYLYDVRIGKIVPELVKKYGGTPVKTRVGHSFIKAKMKEHSGIFGGELAGHFYFQDNFNTECTLMCGLLMMQIISERGIPVSEIAKEFDVYVQSGEINYKIGDKQATLIAMKEKFAPLADSVEEIDGVVFNYPDWWFGIRFSNTEPVMRINLEGNNREIMEARLSEVLGFMESLGAVRK